MSKVEKYKQKLEKFKAEKAEQAKLFSIDEVLADTQKIKEKYVPELDCIVRYGEISFEDWTKIAKAKNTEERGIYVLWVMLSKADPNITLEKVKKLPLQYVAAITKTIVTPLAQIGKR